MLNSRGVITQVFSPPKSCRPPGPPPDYSYKTSVIATGTPGDARVVLEVSWESHEQELNGETAPWKNETIAQFPIDVICTEETPKPGVKTDVFWHGVAWDGTQTKASKPK